MLDFRLNAEHRALGNDASRQTHLRHILDGTDSELLERAVDKVKELLPRLLAIVSRIYGRNSNWTDEIQVLVKRPKNRLVIGVVGCSGDGKSSLLNAVLDMEDLLRTSNDRACTAIPTEILFNDSQDENSTYRAEVEYISENVWRKELENLASDLCYRDGSRAEQSDEFKTALGKIKAVYGTSVLSEVSNRLQNIDKMVLEKKMLLGTIEEFSGQNVKHLQEWLQKRISVAARNYPLVKVARIYAKSPVLKSGIVLVDLPGAQDVNLARSAVAELYIKECTGIWVVSDIVRAVTNKVARDFLDDSMRRQLVLDGMSSDVTFICTKTDQMNFTSATRQYRDSVPGIDESLKEKSAIPDRIAQLKKDKYGKPKRKKELRKLIGGVKADIKQLEAQLAEDSIAITEKGRKRKSDACLERPPKVRRLSPSSPDSSSSPDPSFNVSSGQGIEERIAFLREQMDRLTEEADEIDESIERIDDERSKLEEREHELQASIEGACIMARNERSKADIRETYAESIREIDQDLAEQKGSKNIGASPNTRDYKAIAEALPVFCVSSTVHQLCRGRLEEDRRNRIGFVQEMETGIPELQAHCDHTAKSKHVTSLQSYLAKYSSLVASLTARLISQGGGEGVADKVVLQKAIQGFRKRLGVAFKTFEQNLEKALTKVLFQSNTDIASHARSKAIAIVQGWPETGMPWNAYRAVVRRNGVHRTSKGLCINFNDDLVKSMIADLQFQYQNVFDTQIPKAVAGFLDSATGNFDTFRHDVVEKIALSEVTRNVANNQIGAQRQQLNKIVHDVRSQLVGLRKDAHRALEPSVSRALTPTYACSYSQTGPGMYKRMRDKMEAGVKKAKKNMFHNAMNEVKEMAEECLHKDILPRLRTNIDAVFDKFDMDMRSLAGKQQQRSTQTEEDGKLKLELLKMLIENDEALREIANEIMAKSECNEVGDVNMEDVKADGAEAEGVHVEDDNTDGVKADDVEAGEFEASDVETEDAEVEDSGMDDSDVESERNPDSDSDVESEVDDSGVKSERNPDSDSDVEPEVDDSVVEPEVDDSDVKSERNQPFRKLATLQMPRRWSF